MNIIIGEENAQQLEDKYTLLELDQLRLDPESEPVSAYCVLENIPIEELPQLEEFADLHHKMIENYRKQNWSYCEQAIDHLCGRWGGTVDSFYSDLLTRIFDMKDTVTEKWDPAIKKY